MYSDKISVAYNTTVIPLGLEANFLGLLVLILGPKIFSGENEFFGSEIFFLLGLLRPSENWIELTQVGAFFLIEPKKIEYIFFFASPISACITCFLAKSIVHTTRSSEQNYKCICHYPQIGCKQKKLFLI